METAILLTFLGTIVCSKFLADDLNDNQEKAVLEAIKKERG